MSTWLANSTLAHLRNVADWPDVGERYEVSHRLGRGGMGVVYAAHDRMLDRAVAIKVLDTTDVEGGASRRLQEEARILGRLEHPGIVPVHDAGTLADGRVLYVMKLVRGERLDRALDTHASLGGRLELFLRICDAVSFAHAQGIVHRDLKPENVMLVSRLSGSRHNSRAGHPAWRRCSSLKYAQYSHSSRLAMRAPRSGTYATIH